jgi:C4-dicarboxylate-binding protein DctP
MEEATAYGNDIAEKENVEALEAIKKSGRNTILIATDAENAAMRKQMEPIYDDMAKRVGKATIEEFVKEAAGATN